MNYILNSFQLINHHFPQHLKNTFSESLRISSRELKIAAVAVLVSAVLGQIVYRIWRDRWPEEVKQQKKDHSLPAQKTHDLSQSILIKSHPSEKIPGSRALSDEFDLEEQQTQSNKNDTIIEEKEAVKKQDLKVAEELKGSEGSAVKEELKGIEMMAMEKELKVDESTKDENDVEEEGPAHNFKKLFSLLQSRTPEDIPSLPLNGVSCRFSDILCPIDTHVFVPGETELLYFHANHVKLEGLHCIATQYPLYEQTPFFWRACQQACLIVDLTNAGDKKKGLSRYYPPFEASMTCGEIRLTCISKQRIKDLKAKLCTYHVEEKEAQEKLEEKMQFDISRLHFKGWNDYSGISEDDLDKVLATIKSYQQDLSKPVIIHCRAGVGRTGTVFVAYALQLLMEEGKVNVSNLMDHLCRLILKGRAQRGPNFVQSPEQIEAIWKWSWRALHRMLLAKDNG